VAKGYFADDMADAWSRYNSYTATDDLSEQVSPVADPVADDDWPDVAAPRLNRAACDKHADTGFGPHSRCVDCQALR
jgi:hypothetical protein